MSVTKRFIIGVIGSVPYYINMFMGFGGHMLGGENMESGFCLYLVLWFTGFRGYHFLRTAIASFKNHHANMDTLVDKIDGYSLM
ncbi:hypothetical protein N42HA_00040 [Lactococcus lactis]|nr:hypothetical protein [Lactococcus lactis]